MKSALVSAALTLLLSATAAAQNWQIKEDPNGDGTSDVRVFNSQGNPGTTVISNVTEGTFAIGPSFGSELIAVGVTEGIAWSNAVVFFDPAVVTAGASRNTLYSTVALHDPSTPAPPDPFVAGAEQMRADAALLLLDPGNITPAEAQAFLEFYVFWFDEYFP